MSEFLYVTVAALGILVAGGILGGFGVQGPAGGATGGEPLFFENLGTIGAASDVEPTSRTIGLGDLTVQETSPNETVQERDEITVWNGFRSEDTATLEFDASNPQAAYLSVIPTQAADTDNLIVRVNGDRVAVDSLALDQRNVIRIDGDHLQRGSNVIRIAVADQGFAVWRSPAFTFENAEVILHDLQNDGVTTPFRASESIIQGFDHGEIRFFATQDVFEDEPMRVRLNGNTIAERTPVRRATPYTISFFANTTGLSVGENVLTFSTGGDSAYPLQNAEVTLYYYGTSEERTTIREFDVPQSSYEALGRDEWEGRIAFDVEQILLDRPLSVQLPNRSYVFRPAPGRNELTFDRSDIRQDTNELQLATAGSYRITNFNVSLARTD